MLRGLFIPLQAVFYSGLCLRFGIDTAAPACCTQSAAACVAACRHCCKGLLCQCVQEVTAEGVAGGGGVYCVDLFGWLLEAFSL